MVFEAVGDGKVRVTSQGWDDARMILAETMVAARVQRALKFLNIELTGLAEAGYGPETK
jgi:hypothetical protein